MHNGFLFISSGYQKAYRYAKTMNQEGDWREAIQVPMHEIVVQEEQGKEI